MRILFLHGWQSAPGGVKPSCLKDHGHEVINPKLPDDDFAEAVRIAQAEFDEHQPQVVVGSSRGGAVAMNIDSGNAGLVLLCPAWKKWGRSRSVRTEAIILHSRADDVVPFANSEELAKNSRATLIEVGNDHRLADPEPLSVMLWACEVLGSGGRIPQFDEESLSRTSTANPQKDVRYICDSCGEEIVIPLDRSEGSQQTYVEDCPVCCRANTIHVEIGDDGEPRVWAEPEQDRE